MKVRVDHLLVQRSLAQTRSKAQALILAGEVIVDDHRIDKSGTMVPEDAEVRLKSEPLRYVSRGGLKLEAALDAFAIDPAGLVAIDVGASTGGFTDCLLQRGAVRVYAIDVGTAQLAEKMRQDPRVVSLEGVNVRTLTPGALAVLAPGYDKRNIGIVVADASFISLTLLLGSIAAIAPAAPLCALVKPQFEAGRENVGKGGLVKDVAVRAAAIAKVADAAATHGYRLQGSIDCPIAGKKSGNVEALLWLLRDTDVTAIS